MQHKCNSLLLKSLYFKIYQLTYHPQKQVHPDSLSFKIYQPTFHPQMKVRFGNLGEF